MDCIEGESYETRLRRIGREPDQASLMAVIEPLLDGLQEVHAAGLLHRDIKPENILFDKRGHPILIDFGAARSSVGATMTMTSIVTHGYSPFEQYQTKGKMGPWTDIYAVGAVMYRAISGNKPPVAADRMARDEYMSLASSIQHEGYSSALLLAVDSALSVFGENRPQSVAEWRSRFDAATPCLPEPWGAVIAGATDPIPNAENAPARDPATAYRVACPHCNWTKIIEDCSKTSFECDACNMPFHATPAAYAPEVEPENEEDPESSHDFRQKFRDPRWKVYSLAALTVGGILALLLTGFIALHWHDERTVRQRADPPLPHEKSVSTVSQNPIPSDAAKLWREQQLRRVEEMKRAAVQAEQERQDYLRQRQQERIIAEQNAREETIRKQQQEELRLQQLAEQTKQETARKKVEREANAQLASQKLQEEAADWNAMTSKATPQNPFVNSIGMRFARLPETNILISLAPVSQAAFNQSRGVNSSADTPAIVSWDDAMAFFTWLSIKEGKNYHLPTQKEWNAARQAGLIADTGVLWMWCADIKSTGGGAYDFGDGKVLRGNSIRDAFRNQRYDDVGVPCVLSPRL